MNKFLESNKLPKLNQEEIQNQNKPIASKKIESVAREKKEEKKKRTTYKKISGLDGFIGECWQVLKEELIAVLPRLFQKIEGREGVLPDSFDEASIILLPNPKTSQGNSRSLPVMKMNTESSAKC